MDNMSALGLEDLKTGRAVVLSSLPKEVPKATAALVGLAGTVQSWDAERRRVLVEFYDAEAGMLRECWLPLTSLSLPPSVPAWAPSAVSANDAQRLIGEALRTHRCLAALYARRSVLALLRYSPLRPGRSPSAEELLQLAGKPRSYHRSRFLPDPSPKAPSTCCAAPSIRLNRRLANCWSPWDLSCAVMSRLCAPSGPG